jgi:hypothetical protein
MRRKKAMAEQQVDDFYADIPVVETWRECHDCDGGWRGVRSDGQEVFVRPREGSKPGVPVNNRLLLTNGVAVTGIILLERAAP